MIWPRIRPDAAFVCGKYHFIREGCIQSRGSSNEKGEAGQLFFFQGNQLHLFCGGPIDQRGAHPDLACLPREIITNFGIIMPPADRD